VHGYWVSLCYRKDDRAMRPIYGCPEKFRESHDYAYGYFFPKFLWPFVPIDPMKVRTKFDVRSFSQSWDNIGIWYPKNVGSPDTPTLPFLLNFYGLLSGWTL